MELDEVSWMALLGNLNAGIKKLSLSGQQVDIGYFCST